MSDQQPLRMPDEQEQEAFRASWAQVEAELHRTGQGVTLGLIYFTGWLDGRDWAREQIDREAAEADEMEADSRDRYERAAALGRHLHDYYADEDTRGGADLHERARR